MGGKYLFFVSIKSFTPSPGPYYLWFQCRKIVINYTDDAALQFYYLVFYDDFSKDSLFGQVQLIRRQALMCVDSGPFHNVSHTLVTIKGINEQIKQLHCIHHYLGGLSFLLMAYAPSFKKLSSVST